MSKTRRGLGVGWKAAVALTTSVGLVSLSGQAAQAWVVPSTAAYIVSDSAGVDFSAAQADVLLVGGGLGQQLSAANAVEAGLTLAQVARVAAHPDRDGDARCHGIDGVDAVDRARYDLAAHPGGGVPTADGCQPGVG